MGYVDKEIIRQRKVLGDAVSGKNLRSAIRKLQEKSQIKDSLAAARERGAIVAKRKLAKPVAAGSVASYVEASRTFYTNKRTLRSSDGIFAIEYRNVHLMTMTDGTTFEFLDFNPEV